MNPAHKHVGPNGPGQIKNDITLSDYIERKQNSFDRYPYMKHSTAEPISETPKKKLTFDEWWNEKVYDDNIRGYHWGQVISKESAYVLWKAAQQNA